MPWLGVACICGLHAMVSSWPAVTSYFINSPSSHSPSLPPVSTPPQHSTERLVPAQLAQSRQSANSKSPASEPTSLRLHHVRSSAFVLYKLPIGRQRGQPTGSAPWAELEAGSGLFGHPLLPASHQPGTACASADVSVPRIQRECSAGLHAGAHLPFPPTCAAAALGLWRRRITGPVLLLTRPLPPPLSCPAGPGVAL